MNFDNTTLLVTHNIGFNDLKKSMEDYEGIVCPSLAIHGLNAQLNDFGSITLIFDPSVLYKSSRSLEDIYNCDFYSETFPQEEYVFSKWDADIFWRKLEGSNYDTYLDKEYLGFTGNRSKSDTLFRASRNAYLKHFYLSNILGEDIGSIPLKEKRIDYRGIPESEKLIDYLKAANFKCLEDDISEQEKILEVMKKGILLECAKFGDSKNGDLKERIKTIKQEMLESCLSSSDGEILNLTTCCNLGLISRDLKDRQLVPDEDKLEENINKAFDQSVSSSYEEYLAIVFGKIFQNRHFKLGRKKCEFTEDNIIRYFKRGRGVSKQENLTFSLGQSRSNHAIKLSTFNEIIFESENLVTSKEMEDISENTKKDFFRLVDMVYSDEGSGFNLDKYDDMSRALSRIRGLGDSYPDEIEKLFERMHMPTPSLEACDLFKDIHGRLSNSKTDYFECKPLKNIPLDLIKGIVFPSGLQPVEVEYLKSLGVPTLEYQKLNIENRDEKVSSFLHCSISQENVPQNPKAKKAVRLN